MIGVQFGLGEEYDNGYHPSIAMDANGLLIEVHQSEGASDALWSRTGRIESGCMVWNNASKFDDGKWPSCALNNNGLVVEVHGTTSKISWDLWYRVGHVKRDGIEWHGGYSYDSGEYPAIALNDKASIVEVHKSQYNSGLWFRTGSVSDGRITFAGGVYFSEGREPKVAINNRDQVVIVYRAPANDALFYQVGSLRGGHLELGEARSYDTGKAPTVALTDDGVVIEVHESDAEIGLWQRLGRIADSGAIDWQGSASEFDNGALPSVAASGSQAVQVHRSEMAGRKLWGSVSLLTDRSKWMEERMGTLGHKRLRDLVMPAAHDAGMYSGLARGGETQNLTLYEQLSAGIRYFDLRPVDVLGTFYVYHTVTGPSFSVVLEDIAKYMREGHREFVILKMSHYTSFGDSSYENFIEEVKLHLDKWLIDSFEDKPLREQTLTELTAEGGRVLVVCDGDEPLNYPLEGIWVYRDWSSRSADKGDLVVFDEYSDSDDLNKMSDDQIRKFTNFKGVCENSSRECDMFLLSWTLTAAFRIWLISRKANRVLSSALHRTPNPNAYGRIINLLYADYVQYSRATDLAILLNTESK